MTLTPNSLEGAKPEMKTNKMRGYLIRTDGKSVIYLRSDALHESLHW